MTRRRLLRRRLVPLIDQPAEEVDITPAWIFHGDYGDCRRLDRLRSFGHAFDAEHLTGFRLRHAKQSGCSSDRYPDRGRLGALLDTHEGHLESSG